MWSSLDQTIVLVEDWKRFAGEGCDTAVNTPFRVRGEGSCGRTYMLLLQLFYDGFWHLGRYMSICQAQWYR